jgi:hypothetical protein
MGNDHRNPVSDKKQDSIGKLWNAPEVIKKAELPKT